MQLAQLSMAKNKSSDKSGLKKQSICVIVMFLFYATTPNVVPKLEEQKILDKVLKSFLTLKYLRG